MTTTAAERTETTRITIRPYRDHDRHAVRDLQCLTAFRGVGQSRVFSDRELFADYWTRYYTDFEPESVLVAERDRRVVGYLVGCRDTRRHVRLMATRVVPAILSRLAGRAARGRYASERDRRFLKWFLRRSWREAPRVSLEAYPGHFHCNVDRSAMGEGLFSRLARRYAGSLIELGVRGVHLSVTEPVDGIWRQLGLRYARAAGVDMEMIETRTSFVQDVLGRDEPHVNRVFASSTEALLGWVRWLGERRGL